MLLNELDNLFIKRIGVFFLCFLLFNLKKKYYEDICIVFEL